MSSADSLPKLDHIAESLADEYIPGEFREEPAPSEFKEFAADETPDRTVTAPPVLFMAAPSFPQARFGTLFWLAHTLGLDVYGTTTLSYAARTEMIAAALVLTIIFLFDAGAWCLLFYFILNSGSLSFSAGLLVLSLAGILPALALLLYERSFMTADTKTRGWRRLLLPTIMRLGVIFGAAWMTAQPVELMAFRLRIERRVQDELIRKAIVRHEQDLHKAEDAQKNAEPTLVPHDMEKLNRDERDLTTKNGQLAAAEAELGRRKQARKAAESRLQAARSALNKLKPNSGQAADSGETKEAIEEKQKALEKALAELNDWNTRVAAQESALGSLQNSIKTLTSEEKELRGKIEKSNSVSAAKKTEKELKAWVDKLRDLQPGEDLPDDPETGVKSKFVDYSFLDKFRIIDDLLAGRPARWPGADQETIESLKRIYGLYDDHDNATDPKAQERIAAESRNARRAYYAVFGVALIIPFMSLLFKLIMPAPLSYYYSSEWQSQQGHPEAMALEAAAHSMRGPSRRKRRELTVHAPAGRLDRAIAGRD